MIFNAFQREDDDAVFTVAKNAAATAYLLGEAASWDIGASADGVRVNEPAAASLGPFRGVCAEFSIAASGFGKFQVHGYNDDALINAAATAGDVLVPVAGFRYLTTDGAGDGTAGLAYAAADFAGPGPSAGRVFLRAL